MEGAGASTRTDPVFATAAALFGPACAASAGRSTAGPGDATGGTRPKKPRLPGPGWLEEPKEWLEGRSIGYDEDLLNQKKPDLSGERLELLPEGVCRLPGLEELGLFNNCLTSLPREIGNMASLKRLDLSCNRLTSLPDEIGRLANLEELGLFDNYLASLPGGIWSLAGLKRLDLSWMNLESLPREVERLANLEELDSWMNLESLPREIWALAKLRILGLSHNRGLGPSLGEVGGLAGLKKLDLSWMGLRLFPGGIEKLGVLEELDLSGNDLRLLPGGIRNLTKLRIFRLSKNSNLESLPGEIGNMASLKDLDLSGTRLSVLPDSVKNLEELGVEEGTLGRQELWDIFGSRMLPAVTE